MPHKRNPVLSENLTGPRPHDPRRDRPGLENVALWHERDISHSSVERVMLPDACILADFALHPAGAAGRRAGGLSRAYAAQSGRQPGPLWLAARAAGPDRGRLAAATRLRDGPAPRDAGVARGPAAPGTAAARTPRSPSGSTRRDSPPCSTSTTTSLRSTMYSSACSAAPRTEAEPAAACRRPASAIGGRCAQRVFGPSVLGISPAQLLAHRRIAGDPEAGEIPGHGHRPLGRREQVQRQRHPAMVDGRCGCQAEHVLQPHRQRGRIRCSRSRPTGHRAVRPAQARATRARGAAADRGNCAGSRPDPVS